MKRKKLWWNNLFDEITFLVKFAVDVSTFGQYKLKIAEICLPTMMMLNYLASTK